MTIEVQHPEATLGGARSDQVVGGLQPAAPSELTACLERGRACDELEQLVELLGEDADPGFIALTYDDLFAEWDDHDDDAVRAHVAALRARYGDVVV